MFIWNGDPWGLGPRLYAVVRSAHLVFVTPWVLTSLLPLTHQHKRCPVEWPAVFLAVNHGELSLAQCGSGGLRTGAQQIAVEARHQVSSRFVCDRPKTDS